MNRQQKRIAAKQQKAGGGGARKPPQPAARRTPPGATGGAPAKKRVGTRQFLREVRQELKKVQWPTRKELWAYTAVVLVTVTVMTGLVFLLDTGFSRLVLNLFTN